MRFKLHIRPLNGFSLIEISMVLLIVGVMIGSALKGRDLLEQAKTRSTSYDFARLQTAILLYSNDYGSDILKEPTAVWQKLYAVNLLSSAEPPTSKLGGHFVITQSSGVSYMKLGKGDHADEAFLTAAQIKAIQARLSDSPSASLLIQNQKHETIQDPLDNAPKDALYTLAIRLF